MCVLKYLVYSYTAVEADRDVALFACPQVSMAAGHTTASGPTVTLVQLPNGQTVQVHGVIQAAQPSVIQSPQVQTVQVSEPVSPAPALVDLGRNFV